MTTWSRSQVVVVDQRGESLPPAFCPKKSSAAPPVVIGDLIRSDEGRMAAKRIVAAIDEAREVVVGATFLLADGAIEEAFLRAGRRGVRVYLLLAAEVRLGREVNEDSEFDLEVLEEHKQMLQQLAGWALVRSSESFHAKVVLVDPHLGGAGFLLTANLTTMALQRNEELCVVLSPAEVREVLALLRRAFWEEAQHELLEPGVFAVARPIGQVPRPPPGAGIFCTSDGTLVKELLELIRAAQRTLVVASFGFDANHVVVEELCRRAREGVAVTVLARVRAASMPALLALAAAGARVVGFRWLHAKALLADGERGLVMSANLQKHGLDEGFELGVRINDERGAALGQMLSGWCEAAPLEFRLAPKLGEITGTAQIWRDPRLVSYAIASSQLVDLPSVVAASADDLVAPAPVAVPRPDGLPIPAYELHARWQVTAPQLVPGATPLDLRAQDGGVQAMREPGGRVVVAVRTLDELSRGVELRASTGAEAIVVRGTRP